MSKRELFESSMALEGSDVAPPMSLSAPELGCGDPPDPPPIRSSFSSTELLHDRAMARFYQDMAREEAESSLRRRSSLQRRRSFERRSSASKGVPERTESLQDLAASVKSLEPKVKDRPEVRTPSVPKVPRSELVHGILTIEKPDPITSSVHPDNKSFSKDSMDSMLSSEDLRGKILVKQTSEESTADMEYEDSSFDEDEEDEYDEEEEEPITDDVIEEEMEEELDEEEEEDLSSYEKRGSLYTTSESEEDAQYSYSLEEDTYHPTAVNIKYDEDTMISAYEGRGPLILGSTPQAASSSTFPKQTPFGESAAQAGPSNSESKLKPILKRPSDKNGVRTNEGTENILAVTNTSDQKPRSPTSPEKRFEPNFSAAMPKPILKVREASQERQIPVTQKRGPPVAEVEPELNLASSSRNNLDELSDYESGSKKKQVRIEEPGETRTDLKKEGNKTKLGDSSRQRSGSMEDDADSTRVLISHYSDIVAEYSKTRKPPRKLYLDYEALKAAAEKEEANMTNIPEITVNEPESEPQPEPQPEPQVFVKEEPIKHEKPSVHFEPIEDQSETHKVDRPWDTKPELQKPLERIPEIPPPPAKKRSSSPRKRQRSQSRETTERAPKQTVEEKILHDKTEYPRTPSPVLPPRPYTPTERKVHSYFDFLMDFSLFLLACWLYLFKDERLSIPVLGLMIYRQAHDAFQRKMEALRKKIPKRILFWRKN